MTVQEYMPWIAEEVENALRFVRVEQSKLSMWGEVYTPVVDSESRAHLEAELEAIYAMADEDMHLIYACYEVAMMES